MKQLSQYIIEKLKINSKSKVNHIDYKYHPKDKDELIECVKKLIRGKKDTTIDLNCIDISKIDNLSNLFSPSNFPTLNTRHINLDVSNWDVRNVKTTAGMFTSNYYFNCDLSKWDVRNIKDMQYMFCKATRFEGIGLENWHPDSCENFASMFYGSKVEKSKIDW